jgi:hypothetical protein
MIGPLRTSDTSTWAPIARWANVQSVCRPRANSRWHVWPQETIWTTTQDVKITWTWKRRTELLYVAKIYSSTLIAVDIGHTLALP